MTSTGASIELYISRFRCRSTVGFSQLPVIQ